MNEEEKASTVSLPNPIVQGTFAIYDDGKGGLVIVSDADGIVRKHHVPAKIIKLVGGGGIFKKFTNAFQSITAE